MIHLPLVYLAAPYSQGDTVINLRCQTDVYNQLVYDDVVVPMPPLLISHLPHLIQPRKWGEWLNITTRMLECCDACLRLPAVHHALGYREDRSTGSDIEEAYCKAHDIPVFRSIEELYEWANLQP